MHGSHAAVIKDSLVKKYRIMNAHRGTGTDVGTTNELSFIAKIQSDPAY
jgi:hypothetical protein